MTWLSSVFSPLRPLAWKGVKSWVHQSFPSVGSISTADLANWLAQDAPSPVLIDARREAEYAISHLPQAIWANTVEAVEEAIKAANISTESPIVFYCSVGYRSARLAQTLQAAGYTVMNLEGSLFQWANEGRPLVADGEATYRVHPYSRLWELLLEPSD